MQYPKNSRCFFYETQKTEKLLSTYLLSLKTTRYNSYNNYYKPLKSPTTPENLYIPYESRNISRKPYITQKALWLQQTSKNPYVCPPTSNYLL